MQIEAADAFDISQEPESIRDAVRPGRPGAAAADRPPAARARRPLRPGLARRRPALGQPRRPRGAATASSPASATGRSRAFLTDLKQRGLLDDTLVIWGGEFGRTPTVELPNGSTGKINGRDHNHYGFTMWLAGGGVKGGYVHGATDEFGFQAVENQVHVHDLHATILHLLGFDHEQPHLSLRRPRLPPDRRARHAWSRTSLRESPVYPTHARVGCTSIPAGRLLARRRLALTMSSGWHANSRACGERSQSCRARPATASRSIPPRDGQNCRLAESNVCVVGNSNPVGRYGMN